MKTLLIFLGIVIAGAAHAQFDFNGPMVARFSKVPSSGGGGGGGPTPDLLWYKFNEGSGTAITDSSVAGNNGTATSPTWTTGPNSNGALQFNGTSTAVAMNSAVPLVGSSFSISCWVNLSGTGNRTILSGATPGTITLRLNSSSQLQLVASQVAVAATSSTAVTTGWHEVGISLDTSGNYVFYVDGASAGSGTASRSNLTSNPSVIGNDNGNNKYNGSLDDLQIFSTVLSGTDFATIYSTGAQ